MDRPDDVDETELLLDAMMEGGTLTAAQVEELEVLLSHNADDLLSRIKILGHDASGKRIDVEVRTHHILWIIENKPEIDKLFAPMLTVHQSDRAYKIIADAWRRQSELRSDNIQVLRNAAYFFRGADDQLVLQLLSQAASIDPEDLEVMKDLAHHYSQVALTAAKTEPAICSQYNIEALRLFEQLLLKSDGAHERFYNLTDIATTAFGAGEFQRATEAAQEMLAYAENFKKDWNYGNAVFWANIVLGKIAFHAGDLNQACDSLLKASQTPGSPQLNSFGPEFELCSQVLNEGRKDSARLYLVNCQKFWEMGENILARWIADIDKGLSPIFEGSELQRKG